MGFALAVAIHSMGGSAVADTPRKVVQKCGLAIVLAADISASVNDHEFRLQMNGFASALRHPEFMNGLAATSGGIAVTLVLWSSTNQQFQAVNWTHVHDTRTAEVLARNIERVQRPRTEVGTGTAVGAAMLYSAKLLSDAPHDCWRKVIDVSGDGRSNVGPKPALARDVIVAQGITINGLAIVSDEPDLNVYYRDHVIGGDAAFVITASNHEAFDVAIRKKLIRELLFRISQR
ncbi:MAG: DUF1194 domain-containing protein [Hyphomicrobiaceae bacterium]